MEHSVVTYEALADYFIAYSNETGNLITNLKLQKIMYYTQAWHLALYEVPFFEAEFQAWVHGPVLPQLYSQYKHFKWHPIIREDLDQDYINAFEEKIGEEKTGFLHEIIDEYFGLSAYELERLTHSEDPWKKARMGLPDDEPSRSIIYNIWMSQFYRQFTEGV